MSINGRIFAAAIDPYAIASGNEVHQPSLTPMIYVDSTTGSIATVSPNENLILASKLLNGVYKVPTNHQTAGTRIQAQYIGPGDMQQETGDISSSTGLPGLVIMRGWGG